MRIVITASVQGDGGYEERELAARLLDRLKADGNTVDLLLLPYERDMLSLPEQILAYTLMSAAECELLITIGFPALFVEAPNKVCYLLQTEPMLSEYWDTPNGVLANRQYSNILMMVQDAMRDSLKSAKHIFCCSDQLSKDIRERLGVDCSTLLYPALKNAAENEVNDDYSDAIICETNLLPWQRTEALVNAFLSNKKNSAFRRLFLYVPNANPVYLENLTALLDREGNDKIVIFRRRVSQTEIEKASLIICAEYNSRRIPNIAVCAAECGNTVVAMDDGAALKEFVPEKNRLACFEELFTKGTRFDPCKSYPSDWELFVKELLK